MDSTKLKTNTSQILNTGKETIKEVEQLTMDALGEVSDRLSDSGRKIRNFIKENPVVSIAAVIAAGFLLAKIVKSRREHV